MPRINFTARNKLYKNIYNNDKYYQLVSETPVDKLSHREKRFLDIASNVAKNSKFDSSKRIGSCLFFEGKGIRC